MKRADRIPTGKQCHPSLLLLHLYKIKHATFLSECSIEIDFKKSEMIRNTGQGS